MFFYKYYTITALFCFLLLYAHKGNAQKKSYYNAAGKYSIYTIREDKINERDTAIQQLLQLYKDSLSIKMEETIVLNAAPLTKAQPESTLGNWLADAAKAYLGQNRKIDACLINYGSLGKDYIGPGPIRRKDFYELIPFENKMLLLSVSGTLLQHICDSVAQINGLPISGISLAIDSNKATKVKINNKDIIDNLMYTLLVNDYLISSRSFAPLLGKLAYQQTGYSLRNILIAYSSKLYQEGVQINYKPENRISYAE